MPPVREASTKPTAATVLPAPVACSNQKRLPAFGILRRLGDGLVVVGRRRVLPVHRLFGLVLVLEVLLAGDADRREMVDDRLLGQRRCRRS